MQVLAQMHGAGGGGSLAITLVALVAMLVPWVVLGVVCWIFWKAKRREDESTRRVEEWRSAHSS